MSECIIASVSSQDRFVCYDKIGKMSVTNRREKAAKFSDAAKAWRVLQSQMPKKKRDGWKVIAYEEETPPEQEEAVVQQGRKIRANLDTSEILEEKFDWDKVREDITKSFSEIIAYKERLSSMLSKVEAELCDCEHACEFFKCDAAHGYKLYAMIRERRIKRRYIKDELWRANAVLSMSYTDIANGGIESAFKEIEAQMYEPRVLKELFHDVLQVTEKE